MCPLLSLPQVIIRPLTSPKEEKTWGTSRYSKYFSAQRVRKISVVQKKKKVPLCLSAKVFEVQTWPQNNHLSWDDRHRSEIVNITHRDVFQPVVIFGERVQPHPGIVTVLWSNNCHISEAPELCQLYEECWNECQVFSCCTKTWLSYTGGGGISSSSSHTSGLCSDKVSADLCLFTSLKQKNR